jgi:hypothetical protein
MRVSRVELVAMGPFDHVVFPFSDEQGEPRAVTVIHGGGGVGKSTLLSAIATSRPGNAAVQAPRSVMTSSPDRAEAEADRSYAVCHYALGIDDPQRPHALCVASPNARVLPADEQETLRRREQAVFDKLARDGGFAFLAIPATRWFGRQPITITAPARTVARYDVRGSVGFEDRSDLARETKQALAYASISSALSGASDTSFAVLDDSMRHAVNLLVGLAGYSYAGLDPHSFEPMFRSRLGGARPFDVLPTRARHLVAFGALATRMLWAAYPGRDPRANEGVITIDEVDLQQDDPVQAGLVAALRQALPAAQWILTTTSPKVAGSCDTRDVLALRRLPEGDRVELFTGFEARTH